VPSDRGREQARFLRELLGVIFAEVDVSMVMKGEDVVGGLEFGDGDEADLRWGISVLFIRWLINLWFNAYFPVPLHFLDPLIDMLEVFY